MKTFNNFNKVIFNNIYQKFDLMNCNWNAFYEFLFKYLNLSDQRSDIK